MTSHVELRDLGHAYDNGHFLFRHGNADLKSGRITAIVGPSGSGKSTLLAILAGWVTPTEGEVIRHEIKDLGWVPQLPIGVSRRTVLDHVMLPMLIRGFPHRRAQVRAESILQEFGLADIADKPYGQLSGGEAQRLMLARAVATARDLMLVDEPTASLDRASARTVIASIRHLAMQGSVVAVATHDLELRDVCDDVIDLGRWADNI